LNLLTGETGSGKSIVVDALGLLFGGRASAEMVRTGAERARISGLFEAPQMPGFHALLASAGIELEEGELLLEREVLSNGKSRSFAASRPVTAALLRELAGFLGDIHGQHDQQMLFSPAAQLEMLDAFAGCQDLLAETSAAYRRWCASTAGIEELDRAEKEKLRLADLWNFQKREIENAALRAGEDAALEQERRVLKNVSKLEEHANAAYAALYDSPEAALARARLALRHVDELCRIDASLQEAADLLKPAVISMEEASLALRSYLSKLEADPARLEAVESRLAAIEKLKRKYGAGLEEILRFLEEVRAQIEAVETAGERREKLRLEREKAAADFESAAARLGEARRAAARKLEKKVETELKSLAMERTVFRIGLSAAEWSERGADAILFLVSPNLGEEPRPLDKVASGGEISRLALALKTSVAPKPGSAPLTLVFDEIDSGIGGRAGEAIGRRLKRLAAHSQVLCVTHLPQVAGFADHHYSVEKREVKGRTVASIGELIGDARTREIGRMLSGEKLTQEALKHAEQLIRLAAGG
jgi:DNA repair protein RecN (Recombination protein N)